MRGILAAILVLLAGFQLGVCGPALAEESPDPPPPDSTPVEPTRIMLYGDSLVMGTTGDWTWRYRLDRQLDAAGVNFDFVGPRDDLFTYTTRVSSQAYRDPVFDTDHASLVGARFMDGALQLPGLVAADQPDVVVAMVGLNDLSAKIAPDQVIAKWRTDIAAARDAAPGLDIVLVQLPHVWWPAVMTYDAKLVELAAELDTPDERVVATRAPGLNWWSDTYDFTHPSATGEVKIAAAVAEALARIGVGDGIRRNVEVSAEASSRPWAPTLQVFVVGSWVYLKWAAVDYASTQNIHVIDKTSGVKSTLKWVTGTLTVAPGTPGHSYEVWMAPVKGYLETGSVSSVVRFTIQSG